jgi:hypothetical protein
LICTLPDEQLSERYSVILHDVDLEEPICQEFRLPGRVEFGFDVIEIEHLMATHSNGMSARQLEDQLKTACCWRRSCGDR